MVTADFWLQEGWETAMAAVGQEEGFQCHFSMAPFKEWLRLMAAKQVFLKCPYNPKLLCPTVSLSTKILTIVYYSFYQPKHSKIIFKKLERDIYLF